MPATEIITHGTLPDIELVDEPNVLVNSLSITPTRDKQEIKGGSGEVKALRYTNPTITFAFDGYISTLAGLADEHPGTAVASLLNFQDPVHGFDPADGVMVYEDPTRDLSTEDLAKVKFNIIQYPFVA